MCMRMRSSNPHTFEPWIYDHMTQDFYEAHVRYIKFEDNEGVLADEQA